MESICLSGDSGAAQLLPARHFPAFSACGRVGGGFSVEGSHSNAQYNRHIRNLTPRATRSSSIPSDLYSSMDYSARTDTPYLDSQQTSNSTLEDHLVDAGHINLTTHQPYYSSITPEALNAAAQAGLAAAAQAERMASAAAADLADTVISDPACGIEGIGLQNHNSIMPNSRSTLNSFAVQDHDQQALLWAGQVPPPPAVAAAAGFVGDYSAVQGYLPQQQQQQQVVGAVPPTVQGSLPQQQQQQQQVGTTMPTTFYKALSTAHGTWRHDGTDFTSGHLEQVLPESWKRRPGTAPARPGTSMSNSYGSRPSSLLSAAAKRRSSTRSRTPTKQQQEQQQQQQSTPIQGPPTPELQHMMDPTHYTDTSRDSWYSYTPVDVLKIEREQQRAVEQQWLSEFHPAPGAKYPQRSAAVYRYMPQRCTPSVEDDAHCLANTSSKCKADAQGSGSEWSASDDVGDQDYDSVDLADGKASEVAVDAVDAVKQPAWWEADEKLARLVKLMLQPSFATTNLVQNSRSTAHISIAVHNSSTAHSCRNNTVYSDGSQDRGSRSQTLGVYDGLIADNAVRAADIGEQMLLYESSKGKKKSKRHTSSRDPGSCGQMTATGFVTGTLQTPEARHATWVAELAQRSVRQRQQQILLEAAGVASASG